MLLASLILLLGPGRLSHFFPPLNVNTVPLSPKSKVKSQALSEPLPPDSDCRSDPAGMTLPDTVFTASQQTHCSRNRARKVWQHFLRVTNNVCSNGAERHETQHCL